MANYSDIRYAVTGTDVYSDITDLPLSGVDTGTQAFVSGSNRLYMWTGTGWYNIALINTNPSLSGADSLYYLSTEGANTVVTLSSTDPEGIPISFTVSHSGLGVGANAIATVTQSNNIFTFTPTTNTALAGTFTSTFTASDGVNVAVANSSFTLAFVVNNSKYTSALITSVGANNAVNDSFVDSSTNSHTITAAGDATQGTFSPYRHGGNSVLFPGGDQGDGYLDMGAAIVPATGSWTFQSWIRVTQHSDATDRHTLLSWYQNSQSGRGDIQVRGRTETNPGVPFVYSDGMSAYPTATTRVDDGEWHHVAVERNGNVWSIWVDGTREDQQTQSVTLYTGSNTRIGQGINTAGYNYRNMNGEMRDVRFSESARYSGAASIDVPTEDETDTTGYSLLCCQSFDPFVDKTDTYTISVVAVNVPVKQVGAGPYDYKTYTSSDHGGSMYFDGTGDYLSITNDTSLTIGTGDFTAEAWIYVESGASLTNYWRSFFALQGDGNANAGSISLYMDNGGDGYPAGSPAAILNGNSYRLQSSADVRGKWTHVALARESGTMRFFVDGALASSASDSTNYNATNPTLIGLSNAGQSNYWLGHVADARFVKGTAVYTSAFTPPTAPLTAITNTSLLVSGTNAGIIDKSQSVETITLSGGTVSSTSQTKYLSSSIKFDGVDDQITIPQVSIGASEDFTIECWHYLTSRVDLYPALFGNYNSFTTGALSLFVGHNNSTTTSYQVAHNGTFPFINAGTINYNQWVHVALVRSGTTMTLYVDGTSVGSGTSSVALNGVGNDFFIGRIGDHASGHIEGYISDFRITKGLARYTANFTPPTAALQG